MESSDSPPEGDEKSGMDTTRPGASPAKKSRALRLLLALIPIALVGAALLFVRANTGGEESAIDAIPVPVRLAKPAKTSLSSLIRLNAHVESRTMVTVVPLVAGIINELPVDIGDAVSKDQVIARLEAERFRLQLRQAEAAWQAAKSTRDRVEKLYQSGASTLQNREEAKGHFEAAESQYELARLQLDWASVKSPLDGVVLVRHLSPGSIASPERPLLTIGTLDELEVRVRVNERWYRHFVPASGSTALPHVILEREGEEPIPLAIRAVSPFVSPDTKTFELVLTVPSGTSCLRPGMFVRIVVELERRDGVWTLPQACLGTGNRIWYVDEGRARSVTIDEPFRSQDAFQLPEELADRAWVYEGQFFLRDGSPVTVLE